MPSAMIEHISEEQLASGLSRTPMDDHVVWCGAAYKGKDASIRTQVLSLVSEPWAPVSLRKLVRDAARLSGQCGLSPDRVRGAVRLHQGADGAAYLLVRRTPNGDFVAVTEIPTPAVGRPLCPGDMVLSRAGARFDASTALDRPDMHSRLRVRTTA
jgi:hypothetical protein